MTRLPITCPQPLASHAALILGAVGLVLSAVMARADTVRVLDHFVLDELRLQGEKIGEFSSLIRDPDGTAVLAVSDRGYVARLEARIVGDDLIGVEVTSVSVLNGPDGNALRDGDFNPEASALLADGSLAIVDEANASLAVFDASGRWLHDALLPEGLRDVARQASKKDGVEALAWTPATGFIAMTEEPQQGEPRNRHTIHTDLAGAWTVELAGPESISIKGMDVAGDRLFILERTRDDVTDALSPFLRIVDLSACMSAAPCTGQTHAIGIDGINDADFEGIAAIGDGRFLLVSDDKIDGDLRSVFALVAVD